MQWSSHFSFSNMRLSTKIWIEKNPTYVFTENWIAKIHNWPSWVNHVYIQVNSAHCNSSSIEIVSMFRSILASSTDLKEIQARDCFCVTLEEIKPSSGRLLGPWLNWQAQTQSISGLATFTAGSCLLSWGRSAATLAILTWFRRWTAVQIFGREDDWFFLCQWNWHEIC